MQLNTQALEKKAIKYALNEQWKEAVKANEDILEKVEDDKNARIRLGRAYLKLKKYTKAKKLFKEILDEDPVNKIALKNYNLATEKSDDNTGAETAKNTRAFIQEPGTSTQVKLEVDGRRLSRIEIGQDLDIKVLKSKITFYFPGGENEIGETDNKKVCEAAFEATKKGQVIEANAVKLKDNILTVGIYSKYPIFEARKQSEKPFIKKGVIEEPELDMFETEDSEE